MPSWIPFMHKPLFATELEFAKDVEVLKKDRKKAHDEIHGYFTDVERKLGHLLTKESREILAKEKKVLDDLMLIHRSLTFWHQYYLNPDVSRIKDMINDFRNRSIKDEIFPSKTAEDFFQQFDMFFSQIVRYFEVLDTAFTRPGLRRPYFTGAHTHLKYFMDVMDLYRKYMIGPPRMISDGDTALFKSTITQARSHLMDSVIYPLSELIQHIHAQIKEIDPATAKTIEGELFGLHRLEENARLGFDKLEAA